MQDADQSLDAILQGIDDDRRATLRRLIVKGAFVAPIVASFAMSGLTVDEMYQVTRAVSDRYIGGKRARSASARMSGGKTSC
jgi:hypothetical protein